MMPDAKEFEQLALQQLDTLYRVARALTHNESRAEDLVQETYLRALRARESFDLGSRGIRPWLLRIMCNLHKSKAQRERRQPVLLNDQQLQDHCAATDPVQQVSAGDHGLESMDQRLVKALRSLPGDYQAVLLMWAVEDLSYKEIAQVLEIPLGTVMSRLYRARQQIRDQLKHLAAEGRLLRE